MAVPPIPIVDIAPFANTTNTDSNRIRQQRAEELHDALRVNGCVGLAGHGVSSELLEQAFAMANRLFNLPYADKMKAPHPNGHTPHRGYSGTNKERGAVKTAQETKDGDLQQQYTSTADYKESYEIGSEQNRVQYNIWLPENILPGFRDLTTRLFWELNKTSQLILEALIESLRLPDAEANAVRALHSGHDNQLRLLHYPPIVDAMIDDESIGRLGAHTDWSTFTFLFQDENAGLEFGDRASGEFIPATPREGIIYMNIGDMFQRISNNIYPSGLHRFSVSGKARGEPTPARYSIPYFVCPAPDGIIEPQASLVAAVGKSHYEPITYQKFAEKMFDTTNIY
ncbi:putative leucoanthocyanidin dioxygenase, partial [Periconia macrospinosa]